MPSISGNHNGRAAYVEVAIVEAARYHEHKQSREPVLRGVRPFKALIDTGATSTMVTKGLVQTLGLQPATKLQYRNMNGLIWATAYLFHVVFWGTIVPLAGDSNEDGESQVSSMHVLKKVITGGEIENQDSFDVLLGMDVIATGNLTIRSDGTFGFVF
jgi:gag-polyprotein putative aspartyl protease